MNREVDFDEEEEQAVPASVSGSSVFDDDFFFLGGNEQDAVLPGVSSQGRSLSGLPEITEEEKIDSRTTNSIDSSNR